MDVPVVRPLRDAHGFQHAGKDEYYYRPLVVGTGLLTYVAHVPPGGDMPPDQEEADLYELSLFMLDGELAASLGGQERVLRTGDGQHIPRGVPFGVRNDGAVTASFVLSFTPPPRSGGIDEMLQDARDRGMRVWTPDELDPVIGRTTFPVRG